MTPNKDFAPVHRINAISNADTQLAGVGLPTYSQLLAALREVQGQTANLRGDPKTPTVDKVYRVAADILKRAA